MKDLYDFKKISESHAKCITDISEVVKENPNATEADVQHLVDEYLTALAPQKD